MPPTRPIAAFVLSLAAVAGCRSAVKPAPKATTSPAVLLTMDQLFLSAPEETLLAALRACQITEELVTDNIANSETTAYKRKIAVHTGSEIMLRFNLDQGPSEVTNRALDVAIEGPGFFKVKVVDTIGDGFAYTRNGNFFVNASGQLVLGLGDGYRVQPPITLPRGTTGKDINISTEGVVSVHLPGGVPEQIGLLQLTNFINAEGLDASLGTGLYRESEASGPAVTGNPGTNGTGIVRSGTLEGSNVDPTRELLLLERVRARTAALRDALGQREPAPLFGRRKP